MRHVFKLLVRGCILFTSEPTAALYAATVQESFTGSSRFKWDGTQFELGEDSNVGLGK